MAKALTHLSTTQCVNIVGQLPELATALETVSEKENGIVTIQQE